MNKYQVPSAALQLPKRFLNSSVA